MTDARQLKVAGATAIGAAVLIAVAVTWHPEGLKAPAWVAYGAAMAFVLAGASALARAFQRESLAYGLVCWLLAALFVLELWIAFGPGARQCVVRISGLAGFPADVACRSVFGLGALLVGAMLLFAVRGWLNRRSEG